MVAYAAYLEIADTFSLRTTARIVATNLEINSALSEKRFNAIPICHFASGKPSSWNRTPGTPMRLAALGTSDTPNPARTRFNIVKSSLAS
jgi:hypothetical protein